MSNTSGNNRSSNEHTDNPYADPGTPSVHPPEVLRWSFIEDAMVLNCRIQETHDGSNSMETLIRDINIRTPFVHDLLAGIQIHGFPSAENVLEAEVLQNCYLQGVKYVSKREHSRHQLNIKLRRKGYSSEKVERVLNELEIEDSLSDRRFAEQWTNARLQRHPEGRIRIISGLQQRGVHRITCEEVLRKLENDDPGLFSRACLNFMLKAHRKNADSKDLIFSCRKRGFSRKNLENCSKEFYSITGEELS